MKKLSIRPEPKKSKYQFLNTIYFRPTYNKKYAQTFKEEYGDAINDFMAIIYRDENTNEKKLHIIPNPKIQYYVANDDVEINEEAPSQIELDKVHIEKVPYKYLLESLCQVKDEYEGTKTDFTRYYRDGKKSKGYTYEANKFHLFNRIFASDIDIEDYCKGNFIDSFPNASRTLLTKSYTDIEVDSIDINGFPNQEDALCPVNAITTYFDEKKAFFTLLLRNPDNPQIEKLEKNKKKFIKKLQKEFGKEYKFVINWFDDELDLIQTYFDLINRYKPDFNMIYNLGFDLVYMLNRIGQLNGFDRLDRDVNRKYEFRDLCAEYVSHPDFPEYLRVAYYIPDTRNQKASEKIDQFKVSSYTQWVDQLCLYASLRKGKELESYSLSDVSQKELKDDKLKYSDSGYNIKTLPYKDYEMFVMYNIKDVLLQVKLEEKNHDLDLLYSIADITKTRLMKAMRKTVSIKNMKHHFDIDQNYVQGNNHNQNYGTSEQSGPTEQFQGAFVADPNLNGYNGTIINGSHSRFIYDYVIDYDYSV